MIRIKLSRILGEMKWSQSELARKADIRPNTLSGMYNELVDRVSLNQLDKICDVLGCELSDLLEHIPKKAPRHDKTDF